jgi:hypothetical protein
MQLLTLAVITKGGVFWIVRSEMHICTGTEDVAADIRRRLVNCRRRHAQRCEDSYSGERQSVFHASSLRRR